MLGYIGDLTNVTVVIVLFGIFLFYKYVKGLYNLHLKLGHKGPPPTLAFGNFFDISKYGFHELDRMCLRKYGRIYPFYLGNIGLCMVSDEELLKQIFIKETKSFTDRMDFAVGGEMSKKMLTELKGKDWERIRYLVSPTFTSVKLKKMFPMISDGVDLLEKRFSQCPVDKPIDFKEFFGALTLDVIARSLLGMQIDSQTNPNNQFVFHAKKLFNVPVSNPLFLFLIICPKLGPIFHKLFPKWEIFDPSTVEFFDSNLQRAIREREKSSEQYNDFLAIMLNAHKEINENYPNTSEVIHSKYLTNQEIIAQCVIFLLAGYETTATTLTYAAYFLATNRTAQQEVYDEILDTIGIGGELTYDSLANMPLLEAAIFETLRMCPPLVRIDRVCTKDTVLVASDKSTIAARKGDIFTAPVYAIHTDPSVWSDPDKFDLHRFDPEKKKSLSPCSFLPFGLGPRNCVGMRFALLEAKSALASLLLKFEIVPCPETINVLRFKTTIFSTPKDPILLKVVKRE